MLMWGAIEVSQIFESLGTQAESAITSVLPVAAGILAAIIGLKLGIKIFKSLAGKA